MSIDESTAARVAKLARIRVSDDALPALAHPAASATLRRDGAGVAPLALTRS